MINNKAQVPLIKVLVILFVTSLLLTTFMIYLFIASDVPQRDAEFKQHHLYSTLFSSNCLLKQDGMAFNRSSFSQKTIDNCISLYQEDSQLKIELLDSQKQNIEGPIYTDDINDFSTKEQFCGISSSQQCSPDLLIPLYDESQHYYVNLKIITQK